MIISRIHGGLGNQMFQYAFGAYQAKQCNAEHFIDISSYADKPNHGFLLDNFKIRAPIATQAQFNELPFKYRPESDSAGLFERLRLGKLRRVKEAKFGFAPKYLRTGDNSYLVGYWQSEKYFPGLRNHLIEEFTLARTLSDESLRVAEKMVATNSVSLHIRRGDYLTNSAAAEIYEHLPIEYYQKAIEQIALREPGLTAFVFSNDIDWCKATLEIDIPVQYIDHTTSETAYEDMQLMRTASHNVIANSTFSWWAAWLNEAAKNVISPAHWFYPGKLDGSHIIPEHWHTIENRNSQAA